MIRDLLRDRPVFGTIIRSPAAELVETAAAGGLDFILVDHMHSPTGWETAAAIARASKGCGITAFYRPNTAPEGGGSSSYLAAQCSRALSVGFDGLLVAIESEQDAIAVMSVVDRFWQRKLHASTDNLHANVTQVKEEIRSRLFVVAQFESVAALDELEKVVAIPGFDAVAIANSDVTLEVTGSLDAEDSRFLEIVDQVVGVCRENNLDLWCNTGYGFPSESAMVERAQRLVARGANLVLFQSAEFILLNVIRSMTKRLPSGTTPVR